MKLVGKRQVPLIYNIEALIDLTRGVSEQKNVTINDKKCHRINKSYKLVTIAFQEGNTPNKT